MTAQTPWEILEAELAAWRNAGRRATVWWRDDDAVDVSPALGRLTSLAETHGASVILAVIPTGATTDLAAFVSAHPRLSVAQHGFAHCNHGQAGGPASEFPATRAMAERLNDLSEGWLRLTKVFGATVPLPLLVAPYNKVGTDLPAALPSVGLSALSVHGPRAQWEQVWGAVPVAVINTHVDLLRWRPEAQFIGVTKAIRRLVEALQARRLGRDASDLLQDPEEPLGLLTHHLVHGEDLWAFLEALLSRLDHPAIRWADGPTLMREARLS